MKKITAWFSGFFSRRSAIGIAFAMFGFYESLTPSLLPRSWLAQGAVSGLAIVMMYLIGTGLARLAHVMGLTNARVIDAMPKYRTYMSWIGIISMPVILLLSVRDREADWVSLGYDVSERFMYSGVLAVAIVVIAIAVVIAWVSRFLYRRFYWGASKLLPTFVAGAVSVAIVAVIALLALNEVIYDRFLNSLNNSMSFADTNLGDDDPGPNPLTTRSGNDESLVKWEDLGREGRKFMWRGPTAEKIEEFTGKPAQETVRVFVGRPSADTVEERAELAVAELRRQGGFDRKVLVVLTPTGTGWVNEQTIQPIEYFFNGDVATVAVQYSHLPSPMAFVAERPAAVASAQAVMAAIDAELDAMDNPPLLLVAGESLGSYGGQGAFANLDAMIRQADGGMWIGPPPMAHLRREAEERRDPGSLQVRPVVSSLPEIVFGARRADFVDTDARFAFLQQGDDPIVWWDNSLIFRRPDWLEEPLDSQVNPHLRWRPVTTYLQLTADMMVGNNFAEGLGHRYGALPTIVWFHMLDPQGWNEADALRLAEKLDGKATTLR